MEWVETTGRTLEEAKETALDQLGVDEQDAEFEVLEEPRPGLFGRMRGEARVRARVRPSVPRPKAERRDRRRRDDRRPAPERARTDADGPSHDEPTGEPTLGGDQGEDDQPVAGEGEAAEPSGDRRAGGRGRSRPRSRPASDGPDSSRRPADGGPEGSGMSADVAIEEQVAMTRAFLVGLAQAFDVEAEVRDERIDEETFEVHLDGSELGLLVGPKGQTLSAIQELARAAGQRQAPGSHRGRVRIDVAGYRQRRREALERFARQVAEDVLSSDVAKALEPMHPADRKVVHDTINTIDGVNTTSEGEEPFRRVVIMPASSSGDEVEADDDE
ncbi:MAG: RNA-binding cell elongation regulator Jag/EloR [Acidimicrobiia bacterium]